MSMIQLLAEKMNFKFEEPIKIAFKTFAYSESVIVTLRYEGLEGYGEAAPFAPVTGDSQEDVLREAAQLPHLPLNPRRDGPQELNNYLKKTVRATTLRTAIDFAYHDLLGKLKGSPAYQLYSPAPHLVNNSITLFIHDSLDETIANLGKILQQYPQLSLLKIKLKGVHDIERARAIKAHSPNHLQFIVDANQGFADPQEAIRTLAEIQNILGNVLLVEEPCPKKDLKKLREVKEGLPHLPVFADESAASFDDVQAIVEAQAASGINLKLQKTGGIAEAKRIATLCKEHGLTLMVGCMFEGPIGIAAGIAYAVSTPEVLLTDLDFDLAKPLHTDSLSPFTNGQRQPLPLPGFGIAFDQGKLKSLREAGELE